MSNKKMNIRLTREKGDLPLHYVERMVEIITNYFPNRILMAETVNNHLEQSDTVRLAWYEGRIIGFSIASKYKKLTPFYPKPINLFFQRMLYIEPGALYKGLGLRLLGATLRDLFGYFWPFKRFATICRTQNPVVVKMMNMHNITYPQDAQPLPDNIRKFSESLLPILSAEELDDKCLLVGSLEPFKGTDYTDIWNRVIHRRKNEYEEMVLKSAFKVENDRIINNGAFIFLLAYSKPLHFIRYLFH